MKWDEALKEAVKGKIVKYNEAKIYLEGEWLVKEFKGVKTRLLSDSMITNNIWKIEEKKTLSDKIIIDGFREIPGGVWDGLKVYDVKEAIKEFLTFTVSRVGGTINVDDFKEKAKEIFGKRLMEEK